MIYTALEASVLTITPPMRLVNDIVFKYKNTKQFRYETLHRFWLSCMFRPFGVLAAKNFKIIWLSNILTLNVSYQWSCTLN
jgi:hypothetical protein